MSYWESFKKSAGDGYVSMKKKGKVQKLRVDINRCRAQQKSLKQQMGVEIYDALAEANQFEISRIFNEFKTQIDEIDAKVSDKKSQKSLLRGQSSTNVLTQVDSMDDDMAKDDLKQPATQSVVERAPPQPIESNFTPPPAPMDIPIPPPKPAPVIRKPPSNPPPSSRPPPPARPITNDLKNVDLQ